MSSSSSSPEPNGLPLAVAASSSSIDESPVFKNLSPLKPEKAGPYIPRFTNTSFHSPLQVFKSPHLDPQHETRFRDVKLTAGSNDHGHYETQVNVVQITNSEKETQSCNPFEHVQEHVAHPVGLVSMNSTKLQLQSANDEACSLSGIAEPQETTRQPDDGDTGTRELSCLTSSKQTEPLGSVNLDETTGDQRMNERFDEFPELNSKDMNNVQSTMSIHPVSGEQSVAVGNRGGGYDKQDYICQSSSEFNQNVEASEDHNMSSRSVSNRDAMDTNQNHHGTHRHLQFETTNSKNITRYNSQSFDNLKFGVANSRLPGSINSRIFSDAKQKEICASGQAVNYALPISGVGLHSDNAGRSVSLGSHLNISGLMSEQVPQWRHDLAKNSDSSSPSLGVAERFSAQVCGGQAENHTTVAAASVSFQPTKTMKPSNDSLHLIQVEQHPASCQESMSVKQNTNRFEVLNQVSPKRKRKKATTTSESHDGCKRCNCKRSKCLKLYCECFAAGIYCVDSCTCINCFNKPEYEDTVFDARQQIESRNPHAFAPKVVKQSMDSPTDMDMDEDGNWTTPASARHKRGCNCKKSKCLKKYCECYQSKVGCSDVCRCDNCQNSFGAKKDTVYIRVKRWKNEPHEKLNTGQMRTDSITKAAGGEQLSSTWEELDTTRNLTPLVHPCSESVVYADSSNLWDYTQVSQSQLHPESRLTADGSFNWQYPPGFCTQQLYSQAMHYLGNDYAPYEDTIKDGNTHQILTDASTPTKVPKASSSNKMQASPQNFQSEGPCSSSLQSLRSGDKFILHGVSSLPPLNPYSTFRNGSNQNESYDNSSTNDISDWHSQS